LVAFELEGFVQTTTVGYKNSFRLICLVAVADTIRYDRKV